jgi:hypothetical protein
MGLHDTSYWLSWHVYHSVMAVLNAFLIYAFGCLFGFNMFLKNDFAPILLTFWLHGQALVGLAFLASALLSRSTQVPALSSPKPLTLNPSTLQHLNPQGRGAGEGQHGESNASLSLSCSLSLTPYVHVL